MKQYVSFILFGLLYISVPEFTNLVVINHLLPSFLWAIVFYAITLTILFFTQRYLAKLITNGKILISLFILVFGTLGLIFEWVVIGHVPGSGAIQLGMFTYWTGLAIIPYILIDSDKSKSKFIRKVRGYFFTYLAAHIAITILVPTAWLPIVIPLLWTVVYSLFFIFYYQYALLLQKPINHQRRPDQKAS